MADSYYSDDALHIYLQHLQDDYHADCQRPYFGPVICHIHKETAHLLLDLLAAVYEMFVHIRKSVHARLHLNRCGI